MTALEPDELTTKTPTDDNDLDDAAIPLGFSSPSTFHPFFESDEHRFLGDSCLITVGDGDPVPAGLYPLPMGASATRLTYGQLMALGGDFYGDPQKPISDGGADAPKRFEAAVKLLYQEDKKSGTTYKILGIMDEETAAVKKAIASGEEP
jgi:hypothetical protein